MKRKVYLLSGLFAGLIISLALAGCDSSATPTAVALTVEPTSAPVAPLSDLAGATGFRMRNDWAGLTAFSPTTILYSVIKSANGDFSGTGNFSVADGTPKSVTSTVTIDIPSDVATTFLQKIAAFPIKEGTYKPKIDHTDDFPLLTITIDTPSEGTITFYSQSQGDQHTPWGASIQGKDYVIDTAEPTEALALLAPYLHHEVQDQLITEAGKK